MTYDFNLRNRVVQCKKKKILNTKNTCYVFNINRSSVYRWSKLNNLTPKRQRVSKIISSAKCYIRNYVVQRINFKYKFLIRNIKKRYNIIISKSHIYNLLKKMNINRKKICYKLMPINIQKRKQQIKLFKNKIKNIPMNEIVSLDETSIDTHINHKYGWGLKGKIIRIKQIANRKRYTVICAIDYNKVLHIKIILGSANGEIFIDFIKNLIQYKIKNKKTYILLDNAKIHHYKPLIEYVNTIDNVEFIYNVTYSPESNPIEKIFNESKKYMKDNNITNINILRKIRLSFNNISKLNINNCYKKSLNYY